MTVKPLGRQDVEELPAIPPDGMHGLRLASDEDGVGRRAVNATAYRIFRILQWLMAEPLSVEALNRRFEADPMIGRSLSSDSIWLYINTLKALGCRIRRPGIKNGYQYELMSHPFGLPLGEAQLETLARVKAHAQQRFNHQEMLVLDRFLKKVIRYSTAENPAALIEQLFEISRSADYETCRQHIEMLERAVATEQLLRVAYLSPVKGREFFDFLPELLSYEQGVVYVRGERPEYEEPSSLRVDRVQMLDVIKHETRRQTLLERRSRVIEAVLLLFPPEPDTFQGFGLTAAHGIYGERHQWRMQEHAPCCEVRLQMRDGFYLKQKLLSCGFRFQVLAPVAFREDLRATLQAMREVYAVGEPDGEVRHGAC